MSNVKRYLYTFLLIVTCVIASPLIFKQIWETSKDKAEPAKSNAEIQSSVQTTTTSETTGTSSYEETTTTTAPPEPVLEFQSSSASYFDDALFIGDSRTVGISEYGNLQNADYFCNTGMSVYNLFSANENVKSLGTSTNLEDLLNKNQYGKIYFMLGINELGYDFEATMAKYAETVGFIREKQPDAILYVQANLHVTKSRSDSDAIYSNANIDRFNQRISELADGKEIFYIDINEVFDDGYGNLAAEYTSDNAHVYAKYYVDWSDWLCTKTIVK